MKPFSMILNDGTPDFSGTPLFDAEYLRNGTKMVPFDRP